MLLSTDGGEHWVRAIGPVVPVKLDIRDLVFRPGTNTMYVATYGRGVWSVDIPVNASRRRAVRR